MFERLVASLDFPFLLPSFDILRPPNDACLATSTKTGGESREDIINMRVVITLFSVRKLALLSYRECDHVLSSDAKKIGVSETSSTEAGAKVPDGDNLPLTFLKPADKRCETLSPLFRLSLLPVVETFQEPSSATGNDFARY